MRHYLSYYISNHEVSTSATYTQRLLLRDGFLCSICHEPMRVREKDLNFFGCYLLAMDIPEFTLEIFTIPHWDRKYSVTDKKFPHYTRDPKGVSIDHIIRKCDGGARDMSNLRLACRKCNSGRRDYGSL